MKIDTSNTSLMHYTKAEEVLNVLTHLIGLYLPYLIITKCLPLCEGNSFCILTAVLYALGTALTAAIILKGRRGITFVSVGSDGTDGPTDAAGGFADGKAFEVMNKNGVDPMWELVNNNSYYALEKSGYLIKTGATGTNVNDLMMIFTYED